MALTFGGATTDVVTVAAHASINTLAARTVLAWLFPTSLASTKGFGGKGSAGGNMQCAVRTTGDVDFAISRSGGLANYRTATGLITANTWYCIGLTYDAGATPSMHIYTGSLTAVLAEAPSYTISTNGSGGTNSDASSGLLWGNIHSLNIALVGRIAIVAYFNRVLSLGEMIRWQFKPQMMSGCVNLLQVGYNGTGTQPDLSGNANSGTVTGATLTPNHVPLGPMFGGSRFQPYVVAAGGGPFPHYTRRNMTGGMIELSGGVC